MICPVKRCFRSRTTPAQHAKPTCHRRLIDRQLAANNRGVGIVPGLPQTVVQERRPRTVPFALFDTELAPDQRLHTQQWEEIIRDLHARKAHRLAFSGEIVVASLRVAEVSSQIRERLALRLQILHVVDLQAPLGDAIIGDIPDPRELRWILKRKRTQQQCVDNA